MLSERSKRESAAASAERIASRLAITLWTMVRLMRAFCESSLRRYLTALGTSRLVRGIAKHDEAAIGLGEDGK